MGAVVVGSAARAETEGTAVDVDNDREELLLVVVRREWRQSDVEVQAAELGRDRSGDKRVVGDGNGEVVVDGGFVGGDAVRARARGSRSSRVSW